MPSLYERAKSNWKYLVWIPLTLLLLLLVWETTFSSRVLSTDSHFPYELQAKAHPSIFTSTSPDQAALYVEETIHYMPGAPLNSLEYNHLIPPSTLTQNTTLTMFHQLWCLTIIQDGFLTKNLTKITKHCMNYLRQSFLCQADSHLEGMYLQREPRVLVNIPEDYRCRDWSKVYKALREWKD